MEFINTISIIKVEMKANKKNEPYQLVTVLSEFGVANLVNKGQAIKMTGQVTTVKAKLKVNFGKFMSVQILEILV